MRTNELDALYSIDPSIGRSDWIRILMACKAAGISFEDFDSWSSKGNNYGGVEACLNDWESFKEEGLVTVGTLFKYAKDAGWVRKAVKETQDCSVESQKLWDLGDPAVSSHPYIMKKWGSCEGLKICSTNFTIKNESMKGALMIPCYRGNTLATLQFITDSAKYNMPKCKYAGGYFMLGRPTEKIYVVEGIAHAWAIRTLDLSSCVAVSFGVGNMEEVASSIRRKYARVEIVIVADRGTESRVEKMGFSYVCMPEECPPNYDINDLFQDRGTEECLEVLNKVYKNNLPEVSGCFLKHEDQNALFSNYFYINSIGKFIKKGSPRELDDKQFSRLPEFTNKLFVIDADNKKMVREASIAYFNSTVNQAQVIHDVYFDPKEKTHHIKTDEKTGDLLLNTFVPYELVRKKGNPELFLKHVALLLPDQRDQQILLSYMAACVQYVGVKFTWWPLLQGVEGNGKSTLGKIMEYLIGDHLTKQLSAKVLEDKSDSWKRGSFMVIINETKSFHDKSELWEVLKNCITEKKQSMRELYKDHVMIDTYYNGMMFSNYKDCLKKTESERRIVFFITAQQTEEDIKKAEIPEWMAGVYYPWLEEDGYAIIADFLLSYEIPDEFNPMKVKIAPKSSTTAEAVDYNRDLMSQKILDVVDEGEKDGFKGGFIASHALNEFFYKEGQGARATATRLADFMLKLGYIKHPLLRDGRVGTLLDGKRPILYVKRDREDLITCADPVAEYKKYNDPVLVVRT